MGTPENNKLYTQRHPEKMRLYRKRSREKYKDTPEYKEKIVKKKARYQIKHRKEISNKIRIRYNINPDPKRKYYRDYMIRLRIEAINQYGGKCACPGCNINDYRFLTIDHKLGRTAQDNKTGKDLIVHLRRLNWPKDRYQVLCWNCNCAKGIYGICPGHYLAKECLE